MANKIDTVKITKGKVVIECTRMDLILMDQTSDGIVMHFKGGLILNYDDQYMPNEVKQRIKQTIDHLSGNIEINLDNYQTPARIVNF